METHGICNGRHRKWPSNLGLQRLETYSGHINWCQGPTGGLNSQRRTTLAQPVGAHSSEETAHHSCRPYLATWEIGFTQGQKPGLPRIPTFTDEGQPIGRCGVQSVFCSLAVTHWSWSGRPHLAEDASDGRNHESRCTHATKRCSIGRALRAPQQNAVVAWQFRTLSIKYL